MNNDTNNNQKGGKYTDEMIAVNFTLPKRYVEEIDKKCDDYGLTRASVMRKLMIDAIKTNAHTVVEGVQE